MFDDRKCIRFFCARTWRIQAMSNIACYMQQTINFESTAQVQQPVDVRATLQRKVKAVNLWLDARSSFYSRICEFSVTRRQVIRVNVVTLCTVLAAIAIEQQPVVAIVSMVCAGWMVYRLNKADRKGGEV